MANPPVEGGLRDIDVESATKKPARGTPILGVNRNA